MKTRYIQIESKNALLELLKEGRIFSRIFIAKNAFKDEKTQEILLLAGKKRVPVEIVARRVLDRKSRTTSKESIVGLMEPMKQWNLKDLIDSIYERKDIPFFIVLDDVRYSQNIGAIMRTAFAGYVNGIITTIKRSNLVNDEIIRISMGASERIPIVEMNVFSALKVLNDEGIKVFSLDMEGEPYFSADLTGPVALVLGSEDLGVSARVNERADKKIMIPMKEGIGSLNVSASAAIVIYEKVRQELEALQ